MALIDLLKFVTTGAWGSGIARPLTAAEADTNIHSLAAAVQNLVSNPVEGVGISNIAVAGRQLTIYLTDGSTEGPFTLPVAQPRYRGFWQPSTAYAELDIIQVPGYGTYLVSTTHNSGTLFDATLTGANGLYYIQITPDPSLVAQVVNVNDTAITLSYVHASKFLRCTDTAGITVTIPADVFPANSEIHFRQVSAGAISIAGGAGVTLNTPVGFITGSASAGATFTVKCVGPNNWDIFGALGVDV